MFAQDVCSTVSTSVDGWTLSPGTKLAMRPFDYLSLTNLTLSISLVVSKWWGCFDPAYKGTLSNHVGLLGWVILTSNLQLVYILTNKNSRKYYKFVNIMLHCAMFSVIALVNFNVSSLHPMRKVLLKLILVRIWFPERWPDVPSQFITMSICVSSQLLTPVPPHYTV